MCGSHFRARMRRRGFSPNFSPEAFGREAFEAHGGRGSDRDRGFERDWHGHFMHRGGGDDSFGVRRPLRFLAHKLELSDEQVTQFARILDELKTERAQAAVDDRRTMGDFADAIAGEAFDAQRVVTAGQRRADSAQRLREAVTRALQQIHALLTPAQRGRLSYMIRAGVLSL